MNELRIHDRTLARSMLTRLFVAFAKAYEERCLRSSFKLCFGFGKGVCASGSLRTTRRLACILRTTRSVGGSAALPPTLLLVVTPY